MIDETPGASPVEDAPLLPAETQANADSSPATDAPATTADDATPEPPLRDEDGKFLSKKAQQRIDHLTWEKNQREREAEHWRQIAMQRQPVEPAPKVEEAKLPRLEDYGYDEAKYQSALLEYADARTQAAVERRFVEYERARNEQARAASFAERQRAFAKDTPDFEAKVMQDPTLPITSAMRDVILDSETGPELAYWLAENRDRAEQIARLPAHLAALELGRIEGRLQAAKEAKARPSHVTQAPPPTPKVDASDAAPEKVSTTDPASDRMSTDEWIAAEKKRMARKVKANG